MKIRYMAILYTAILFGIAVFMFHNVSAMSYQTVDMVEINERYKTIEQQLQLVLEGQENIGTRNPDSSQKALSQLEQQEECTILLRSDEDYQRRLNAALIENAIILDYEVDGQILFTAEIPVLPGAFLPVRLERYDEYDFYGTAQFPQE